MPLTREQLIEGYAAVKAAADRLEILEFHGISAPVVTACRKLERLLAKAASEPQTERHDPEAPIAIAPETLRAIIREELARTSDQMARASRDEFLKVILRSEEQAKGGPPVEIPPPPVAHGGLT